MQEFLKEEGEVLEDRSKDDPTLEKFESEITKYKKIEKEIDALPTSSNIGWIQVIHLSAGSVLYLTEGGCQAIKEFTFHLGFKMGLPVYTLLGGEGHQQHG